MAYGRPGVYVSERLLPAPITALGTADSAGAVVGEFAQGPETVTLVNSWYEFVQKFGGYNASFPATFGVGAFFQNGGSELYVRRVLGANAVAATSVIAPASGSTPVGTITAKNKGIDGNNLRYEFSASTISNLYNLTVYREGGASSTDSENSNDVIVESFNNLSLSDSESSDYISTVIGLNSENITVTITNAAAPSFSRTPLTGGDDGETPVADDYTDVLDDFSALDRPLILFSPEVYKKLGEVDGGAVADALASWARNNNSFAVLDTEEGLSVSQATTAAAGLQATSYAAVYYPHIYIPDPLGRSSSALRKIGPAGSMAGLLLFTDKQTGPFKAPAGIGAVLRGAVAVERSFTTGELDTLNSASSPVNAIRNIPGAGIVAMGARTLLQDGTANRYVNMRRSLIYLRKRLSDLTQFAIFQNNEEKLWAEIRTVITVFLTSYWNQGGLRGVTQSQAFFVKCDAQNNSPAQIAAGEVHVQVGVALQYPAEFIVIDLSQKTAQA